MNETPAVSVEDLTTTSGQPMFDETTREYLRRVRQASSVLLRFYRTATCPECDEPVEGEGLVLCDGGAAAHVVLGGSVVLGCEGYWVVDPAPLGLDPGQWEDWRAAS
jgi:hypothetical protein